MMFRSSRLIAHHPVGLQGYDHLMRMTIDIRDEALEIVRERARELGKSLGEVVSEAIFATYEDLPLDRERKKRITLPVEGEGGLQPGVSLDASAALRDRMDGTD